jgi:parallel beta-helix repeat protein
MVALIAVVMVPTLLGITGPSAPVAEAALTRVGNRFTVTPGVAAEIQQAIDAARSIGGGRVHIPAGTYQITSKIRVHDNVYVYGAGIDQTILRWAPGASIDNMMSNATVGDGNTNIQVWDLTLDGEFKSNGAGDCCVGLRLNNVTNSTIVNVAAIRHSLDGFYMGYVHTDDGVKGAANVRISGCRANQNGRNGIGLIHGDANVIDHCQINGNNRNEAVAGIDVEPDEGLSVTNSRIVSNSANNQNVGIQIFLPYNGFATTYRNAVCYNTTTGNVSAGIYSHRGDQNIFVGNNTSGNGTNYLVDDSSLEGSGYAGYCTLTALPPHPSTLDTQAAPPSCSPRPTISVTTQRGTPGKLNATISVTRPPAAPNNSILEFKFGQATNATVIFNGQSHPGGNFTAYTAVGTQQVQFVVQRAPTNAPTSIVPFTVRDDCGEWKSFVGGGGGAF